MRPLLDFARLLGLPGGIGPLRDVELILDLLQTLQASAHGLP